MINSDSQLVKKYMFSFLIVIFSMGCCFSQSSQSEYIEAKRQFNLGNYASAKQSFQKLTNDKDFGAYASFYFALSSLKQGELQLAYDMWKQIQVNFPEWNQQSEVKYWLGYVSFRQNKYWEAFNHIEGLPEPLKASLIDNALKVLSAEELEKAYTLNPDNKYLATYLSQKLLSTSYAERNHLLLEELTDKFDLQVNTLAQELPTVKKDTYSIAVVLPFMFDSLENPQSVIRNAIIFDLYLGMNLAQQDLREQDIQVDLSPFDTRKKASVTQGIISDGSLDEADVIVGPLYGGPNEVVSRYSRDRQITMINPVSSNGSIINDNPFSFLFKPSYATQGRVAAAYAIQKFAENKLAFIFYETDRDSLLADAYRTEIEKNGFYAMRFERLTNESAQQVQLDFTEQYEVRLDTLFSSDEIDSIARIPGRYVKTRPLRDEDDGKIIRDDKGEEVLETYENRFYVKEDSIGHMLIATSSNLLANNFTSLVEVRSDTIGLIGYEDWLDFTLISYDQLERLEVSFINPGYIDTQSLQYKELKSRFIEAYGLEPTKYHLAGYELVAQIGQLLDEYGKFFQNGLRSTDYIKGIVLPGLKYRTYNDNQLVPITQLRELRLAEPDTANED